MSAYIKLIILLAILLFVVLPLSYIAANDHSKLSERTERLDALENEARLLKLENDQLRRYENGESFEDYLDRYAREEMGFIAPQERVYNIRAGE